MDMANLVRRGHHLHPPCKLSKMMKFDNKTSNKYKRISWDELNKTINGLVNITNIKNIIPELFSENLVRGIGLFCKSCIDSQMASPGFTNIFAALIAVVNSQFPEVGNLLIRRIILRTQRAFNKQNNKPQLLAASKFIANLINQRVVHEVIALELLTMLLTEPTAGNIEIVVEFIKECGSVLQYSSPEGFEAVFKQLHYILYEGRIDKLVRYFIEQLFELRRKNFHNYPAVRSELLLVEVEDQITHRISLSEEIDPKDSSAIFNLDPQFLENERRYEDLKKQIVGKKSDSKEPTSTNLKILRRTIYLAIMFSVDIEETSHELLNIKLKPGQEMELCIMLLECCSEEKTYQQYHGLLGQRLCTINRLHRENFERCFVHLYSIVHRLQTDQIINLATFFAHLLGSDALPWHILSYISLTVEDTTSSSRIFIKILFQKLSEHLGTPVLYQRLRDPSMQESVFPKDNLESARFAVMFFGAIGLKGLTKDLSDYLCQSL